jgi:hypothetical protein
MTIQLYSLVSFVVLVVLFSLVALTNFNFLIFLVASSLVFYCAALRLLITKKLDLSLLLLFWFFVLMISYNFFSFGLDIFRIAQYLVAFGGFIVGYHVARRRIESQYVLLVPILHILVALLVGEPVVSTNFNSEFIYVIVLLLIVEHGYCHQSRPQKLGSILLTFFVCFAFFYFECWILFISSSMIALSIIAGRASATVIPFSIAILLFIFVLPDQTKILIKENFMMGYFGHEVDNVFSGSLLVRLYGVGFFFQNFPEALLIPRALQGSGIDIGNISSSEYENVRSFHTPLLTIILEFGVYGFLFIFLIWFRARIVLSCFALVILFVSSFSVSDVYLSNFSYWICIGVFAYWLKQEESFVSMPGARTQKFV